VTSSLIKPYDPFAGELHDSIFQSTRVWDAWIKALFAARPVGNYRWVNNPTETEIHITNESPYQMESPTSQPQIVISMGPCNWTSTGIMDHGGFVTENPRVHVGMSSVSLGLNCIAKEAGEARAIAYFVYRLIPVFEKVLQKYGISGIVQNLTLGTATSANSLVQGSPLSSWRLVPIQVPYFQQDTLEEAETSETFHGQVRRITMQMDELLGTGE